MPRVPAEAMGSTSCRRPRRSGGRVGRMETDLWSRGWSGGPGPGTEREGVLGKPCGWCGRLEPPGPLGAGAFSPRPPCIWCGPHW